MPDKVVLADTLKKLIAASHLPDTEVAELAGVNPRTLARWLDAGISRRDNRTLRSLDRLCELLGVDARQLWSEKPACLCRTYAERLQEILDRRQRLGVPCDEITGWVDRMLIASRVAARFRREETDLAAVVMKVKSLQTPGNLQAYLEEAIRLWELDEAASFRRLIENTQRFLAAALPRDADQLGRWFKETHPQRWARLLQRRKIDSDGELIAFIRHMMAEGLSSHEAYEGLIRLSGH